MPISLIVIIGVAALAIGFIVAAAYILQRWLVARPFSSNTALPPPEDQNPEYLAFSEKLKAHKGSGLSTNQIKTLLPVPNSDDKIVMLDFMKMSQNVLRCRPDGSIIWKAELPTDPGDVYTRVEWKDQELKAFSGSCYAVTLDIGTGKILSSVFTK